MAGRRPLTNLGQRKLLRAVRRLSPRDRALVTCQMMTGYRISELLSLLIGSVLRNDHLVAKIGVAPRNLKGGYGTTRWVPVLPELGRALESYLGWLRRRLNLLPGMPLFLSRESTSNGHMRPLSRESARLIIRDALARAGVVDDGRLGTHSLRKTWAMNVFRNSGNDIMVLKMALGHSDVFVTQKYLEVEEDSVMAAIRKCDFTRVRTAKFAVLSGERVAAQPAA